MFCLGYDYRGSLAEYATSTKAAYRCICVIFACTQTEQKLKRKEVWIMEEEGIAASTLSPFLPFRGNRSGGAQPQGLEPIL